jgi:hypothetical protein
MKRTTTTRRRGERGFALIAVLLVGVLLMGIGAAMHENVKNETVLRGTHARSVSGFYTAEAGINRAMGEYRNIFLSYSVPEGNDFNTHSFDLGNRDVSYKLQAICDPPDPDGECPEQVRVPAGRTYSGLIAQQYKYTARAEAENNIGDTESSLGTEFQINYIPMFQFLAFYQDDLEILPGANMTLHGPVHTNGHLYLNNTGNTLTIEDSPPTQPTVNLTAHGNVYRGRKNDSSCAGTVSISKLADTNLDGMLDKLTMTCGSGATRQEYNTSALAPWLGSIKRQQAFVAIPEPDVIDRGTGEFWGYADLRIALDLNSVSNGLYPIVVLDSNDNVDATLTDRLEAFMDAKPGRIFYNDVPTTAGAAAGTTCNPAASNTYCHTGSYARVFGDPGNTGPLGPAGQNEAAVTYPCVLTDLNLYPGCSNYMRTLYHGTGGRTARRAGFYNNREQHWVYMLNVNMHDLLAWNRLQSSGNWLFDPNDDSEGGLVIFLTVKGPNSEIAGVPRYGVRVFGSPNFDFPTATDPTGLTVVSDQALYVEGNYNVDSSATLVYDPLYPKQPAALMGDAINVLSSNWSGNPTLWTTRCRNDCQSRRSLNTPAERPATTTYVNAAFLGGTALTTGSNYGGGFENYPRFHERWTGATLRYRGSIVSLGQPLRSNGAWCGTGGSSSSGCNIYDPPTRDWDYDLDFQEVSNLPPLTPRVISVEQILFTENFR